jgi:transposase
MLRYGNFQMKEEPLLGKKPRKEPMFYYVRMEQIVPENHLLRLVDKHIDFSFIGDKVKHLYSHTGRPSVDPEVLLRMLLIGYLYGITSERRLCEEVQMHIGYRWFVGLSLEDKVPDHSTFSKNRHERFLESDLFQGIFDEIVKQCLSKGLLTGKHLTVDSTYIRANASFKSLEPIVVAMGSQEYIETLERENPVEEKPWEPGEDYPHKGQKLSNRTHRSKTDPDARISRKSLNSGTALYHAASYVMDNKSRIIVGASVGKPDKRTDCEKALEEIRRIKWVYEIEPKSLGADKGYGAGEFLYHLIREKIAPHIPLADYRSQNERGIYPIERFILDEARDVFMCPEGKTMKFWGVHRHSKQRVYRASMKDCKVCQKKAECTRDRSRSVSRHIYEDFINIVRQLHKTKEYKISQRMRKRIEELFGEAKEWMGLERAKFRGVIWIKEQVLMTATAQNIKRMVKLLSRGRRRVGAISIPQPLGLSKINGSLKSFTWISQIIRRIQFADRSCFERA